MVSNGEYLAGPALVGLSLAFFYRDRGGRKLLDCIQRDSYVKLESLAGGLFQIFKSHAKFNCIVANHI